MYTSSQMETHVLLDCIVHPHSTNEYAVIHRRLHNKVNLTERLNSGANHGCAQEPGNAKELRKTL